LGPLLDSRATLARLGGDEFVILLPTVRAKEKVYELCERILELVREPFEVVGTQAFVGVSIGVVFSPDAGTGRMELMRKADIALYRAKADGRDCFRVFEREMDDTVRFRSEIENDLRTALESGSQLRVFYQPQIASAGKRVVGLEALVRWQHPTRGLMSPETFIEIAEDTGLIAELGEWVLKEACGAASRWPTLYIGVNLSPLQFKLPNFSERLIGIVRDAGVCAGQLELEVTETVLLQDDEMVRQELVRLREAGFKIALDDFGTGYSSLSHLHRFEVDRIKVDRTFVKNLGKLDSAAIITAVVNLGHAMGLKVTAEGVETEEQSEFLTAAGCDVMQGHLFAHALPEAELARLMTEQEQLRSAA
jgi:predicted signal transduction protein with EAL and GGDEF domain